MQKCLLCNQLFQPNRFWQKFCNNCRNKFWSPMRETRRRPKLLKTCLQCNTSFVTKIINTKYCHICKKDIVKRYRIKYPERIKKSAYKYRQSHLALCRKRTRIGQIKLNNKKRFGGLRFKVLARDQYQCQICKKDISGKNMACIHHINCDKADNRMNNLISYCKSCHPSYHYTLHQYQFKTEKSAK